jgi:superfamily I DNA/RNA helicase
MPALDPSQRDAVETGETIFCCACPGSGKTRVLVAKVAHILKQDASAQVLMTTFSKDAVNEMRDRLQHEKTLSRADFSRVTIGTFHALALRQLKESGQDIRLLSSVETRHLCVQALRETRCDLAPEEAEAVIARCKSDPGYEAQNPEHARLARAYTRGQRAIGRYDFTDILLAANEGMRNRSIQPFPATHFLADEFQDIDRAQLDWLLFHIQANGAAACAVGDDDQSIYAFRRSMGYAGIQLFIEATHARMINLNVNYRSTAAIIESASRLIAFNKNRIDKRVRVYRGAGILPTVLTESEQDTQAMKIVRRLDKICAGNPVPKPWPNADSEPFRFGVRKGQVAVLARVNAHLYPIEAVFRALRIPYCKSGKSIWDTPVAQVYLALLESLDTRAETGMEIALGWAGVESRIIARMKRHGRQLGGEESILSVLECKDGPLLPDGLASPVLESFVQFGRSWLANLEAENVLAPIYGVAGWMSAVLSGTCDLSGQLEPADEAGGSVKADLNRLEIARDALSVARGLLSVRIRRVRESDNKAMPRVILSTFHAAKGMEWEHVFLVDVNEGTVPKLSGEGGEAELEEERRLFYVAMTRAKDTLTILGRKNKRMSDFLVEAGLITDELAANGVVRAYPKVFKRN